VPVIAACHPKSPAAEAGLKAGDHVTEIDGVKVNSQSELRHQLSPRYAGEKVTVVVLRDKERLERSVELIAKLQPYIHPFLGILPRRDETKIAEGENKLTGVIVRDVYAESPAARSGVQPGDRIVSIDGQPVKDRSGLQEQIAALEPRQVVKVEIERANKSETLEAKLATLPEAVPDKLAPARTADVPPDETAPATGKIEIKIPEAPNSCLAYVPQTYSSRVAHGLVVWLHPAGGYKTDELVAKWKPLCEADDLILIAPKSADPAHWQRTELEFIRKAIEDVLQKYNVDRSRIVAIGQEAGGSIAYLVAGQNRPLVRGIAALNAPLPTSMTVPENDPVQRLAIFTTTAKRAPPSIAAGIKRLREAKHPVTELDLGETLRPLTAEEMVQLARWIDTLDRS